MTFLSVRNTHPHKETQWKWKHPAPIRWSRSMTKV